VTSRLGTGKPFFTVQCTARKRDRTVARYQGQLTCTGGPCLGNEKGEGHNSQYLQGGRMAEHTVHIWVLGKWVSGQVPRKRKRPTEKENWNG
jgi:hypothetical protein